PSRGRHASSIDETRRQPPPMSRPLDLKPLDARYRIVADLGGSSGTHRYLAVRPEDKREVRISIAEGIEDATAPVAEGKALAQFAADANLLARLDHPNVPKVLDGVWLGDDAFAVVSERIHGTTLAE